MVSFISYTAKGLVNLFVDANVDRERLRIHRSELSPGNRSHPPHSHPGLEGFYIFAGRGTLEIAELQHDIGPNESIVFDATQPHCLYNSGDEPLHYLVIIARDA